jgi:hypothetical protein
VRVLVLGFFIAGAVSAQTFTQRGFIDFRNLLYPQDALNDSGNYVGEALLRYEASAQLAPGLRLNGGIDARTDTHRQTERSARLDWQDRKLLRPAFSVRRLSAVYNRGRFTLEAGKQFIRWGKADILNPTDRFAPRDFLTVVDNDFLGVPAVRATYEAGSTTIDAVWQVRFVPSRIPLVNQRWTVTPEELQYVPIYDFGSRFPGGPGLGMRINHIGRGFEASVSFFDGNHYLPLIETQVYPTPVIGIQRYFPHLRTYGADAAIPLRWLTVKGEAAWFSSKTPTADEYVLYVIQLERQTGEWVLVGGYAGEYVTNRRNPLDFAPDRGLADAFLGRASYTIDTNRSIAFEAAVRQNGDGVWVKAEYTQAFGQHWRATAGFTLIRGELTDFLGQYRRNSHGLVSLRYSF